MNFKNLIQTSEYNFLREIPHLNNNIILLGLGGSYSYGTNIETSDIDIRGVATRTAKDILIGRDWEQSVNSATDTTIYSFDKIIKLLCACNPNTIEILGLKPEHYLIVTDIGQELLNNKHLFLSKQALKSFSGYANAQLNRLINKSGRKQEEIIQNEKRSLQKALNSLGVDKSKFNIQGEDDNITIIANGNFELDEFIKIYQVIDNVHTDYRNSPRNSKAIEHGKLAKHQMHLIRLYLMAIDILEKGEIITFREKEHDFLMDIRNGKYLENNTVPTKEFMDILDELNNKLDIVSKKSDLPDHPDLDKVNDFVYKINKNIILK